MVFWQRRSASRLWSLAGGVLVLGYGLLPEAFCFSASRSITTKLLRLFLAAQPAAVIPSASFSRASAPLFKSSCTACSCPYEAAHIKAVPPSLFFTFGFAPARSRFQSSG